MWKRNAKSQHEKLEDDDSSAQWSPPPVDRSKRRERRGYMDRKEILNPLSVSVDVSVSVDDIENQGVSNDNPNNESMVNARQRLRNHRRLNLCIDFFSDLSFFFGSFLYLWLTLSESKDVLIAKRISTTDAPDDYDDDYIIIGRNTNNGLFLYDKLVSKDISLYMVYGITYGILMLAAGALRLYSAGCPSDRIPYGFMIFASILVIASSSLERKNPFWSNACFSIAIHWYALQAATLLLWRATRLPSSIAEQRSSYLRLSGDALFFVAALGGIALSYLHLFEATEVLSFPHEYLSIVSASIWFAASFLYLSQISFELICGGASNKEDYESYCSDQDVEGPHKSLPQEDTRSTDQDDMEKPTEEGELDPEKTDSESQEEPTSQEENPKTKETKDVLFPADEEKSVLTTYTDGTGPSVKDNVAKSSLDNIFGKV